ncbi:MAG: hypothetical protein IPF93_14265 [Saprospiraceae bacterium]|nr:hypothetical protein [Saprospiraceae bacterium]
MSELHLYISPQSEISLSINSRVLIKYRRYTLPKTGRAPMVVTEEMVMKMKQGSVIVDVSTIRRLL